MTILLTRDLVAFDDRARDFLQSRVECNILATVLTAVRVGPPPGGGELFACVLDGFGRVRGAALRIPPRPMLCSPLDLHAADALIEARVGGDVESAAGVARARMNAGGAFFWEHEGRPVSLVAVNPTVAGVARVGPVYTPPSERGRGYAGSAVAALSRRALAEGARGCALFTDLANPTSNKIYAEVGYRRLCDWETIALGPAGEGR